MVQFLSALQIEVGVKHRVVHGVAHDAMRLWIQPLKKTKQNQNIKNKDKDKHYIYKTKTECKKTVMLVRAGLDIIAKITADSHRGLFFLHLKH